MISSVVIQILTGGPLFMRVLTALTILILLLPTALAAGPEVGSKAPDFTLQGSDGKLHRLSDYRGRQPVVVAWFPKAFTGG
jgi:peroxiredoxin Q/BCP